MVSRTCTFWVILSSKFSVFLLYPRCDYNPSKKDLFPKIKMIYVFMYVFSSASETGKYRINNRKGGLNLKVDES